MTSTIIRIQKHAGSFAENKDEAAKIRQEKILPTLKDGGGIILDYKDVSSTTQSFTHALISEALRTYGPDEALDKILFKNCNANVQRIISIVVEYMQGRLNEKSNIESKK